MRYRYKNTLFALASLLVGFLIYALFKPTSIIATALAKAGILQNEALCIQISCPFLNYYFADFLWGFSLCCGLHTIHSPKLLGSVLCGILTTLLGICWEILQLKQIVTGTFDIWDMLMYLSGSILCIIINLRRDNNEET